MRISHIAALHSLIAQGKKTTRLQRGFETHNLHSECEILSPNLVWPWSESTAIKKEQ